MTRTVRIENFDPTDIMLHCYSAMRYKPRVLQNRISDRKCSSFLYVQTGRYRYRSGAGTLEATTGDILYLPGGASYSYEILSGDAFCMQVEFDFMTPDGSDRIVFSNAPVTAVPSANAYGTADLFGHIVADILSDSHSLRRTGNFFLLLEAYAESAHGSTETSGMCRIMPALKYLRENFTEKILVRDLAGMCYLSETQFRRVFRSETGESVVAYKNRLTMNAAKKMLVCGGQSVGEIADALGFPSVYTFSRTFKKYTGISPTAYGIRERSDGKRTAEKGSMMK